jgi:hypothetical protein
MANSSDPDEVVKKAQDSVDKYETDEGGELKFLIWGNADEACVAIPGEGVIDEDAVCDEDVADDIDDIIQGTVKGKITLKESLYVEQNH